MVKLACRHSLQHARPMSHWHKEAGLSGSAEKRQSVHIEALEGIIHYKTLIITTIEDHNCNKRFWCEFVEQHLNAATINAEIIPWSEIPPLGKSKTMQGPGYYEWSTIYYCTYIPGSWRSSLGECCCHCKINSLITLQRLSMSMYLGFSLSGHTMLLKWCQKRCAFK